MVKLDRTLTCRLDEQALLSSWFERLIHEARSKSELAEDNED